TPAPRPCRNRKPVATRSAYSCSRTEGKVQNISLGRVTHVGDLSGNSAFVHYQHAIADAEDFGEVGTDHDDCLALNGEAIDELIDFEAGPHVDAARRFVEDDDAAIVLEPFG